MQRTTSILTGNDNLEILFTLKDFPMSMSTTHPTFSDDKFLDMIFEIYDKKQSQGGHDIENKLRIIIIQFLEEKNRKLTGKAEGAKKNV